MRVLISNYRNHWLSPYTIAQWLCWWREIEYTEPWVVRFEKIMNPPCLALKTVLDVVHPYNSYVKIDRLNYTSEYTCNVAGFMLNFLHSKQVKPPAWAEYRCLQQENNRI